MRIDSKLTALIPCLIFQFPSLGKRGIQGIFTGPLPLDLFLLCCFHKALKKKHCYSICSLTLLEYSFPVTLLPADPLYLQFADHSRVGGERPQPHEHSRSVSVNAHWSRLTSRTAPLGLVLLQRQTSAEQPTTTPRPSLREHVCTVLNKMWSHIPTAQLTATRSALQGLGRAL